MPIFEKAVYQIDYITDVHLSVTIGVTIFIFAFNFPAISPVSRF
jgi:hypothetical protein